MTATTAEVCGGGQVDSGLTDRQKTLLSNLRSWATLHVVITTVDDEAELIWMMQAELVGQNRIRILERIHSRYCVLRRERERRELSEGKLPA